MTISQHSPARLTARQAGAACRLAAVFLAGLAVPLSAQNVAEVQVTPETMTLGVGQRQALFAAAYDRQGNLIPSARFAFWSSDTLIVRVQRDGTVVGVSPGLAKVEARSKGRRASMAVLVNGTVDSGPPPGSVLTLEPSSIILLPGESVSLSAQAALEDGTVVQSGRIGWKSLAPEVATVDSGGTLVAVGPGRTTVQASTSNALMATAPVEVVPAEFALSRPRLVLGPGELDTVRAVVPSQGNRVMRSGIQWRSTDTAVVQVGPTGIVTAVAPGQAELLATGFGQERRAAVAVHQIPQTLVVSPRPAAGTIQLPVRGTVKLSAVAETADSTPIPEARLAWEVGDTAIVSLNRVNTTLTGRAAGTTTVTVRLRGFEPVVWSVDVIPGLVGLDRARVGIAVGERTTVAAQLLDDSSRVVGPAPGLDWSSDHPEIARVSGEGVIDGFVPGRAVVTAAAPWGRSASAEIFVTADVLVASNRSGQFGIYQLRSTSPDSLIPILVDGAANVQPALSPDRTRIAFSSDRHGSYDLFVMDADGTDLRRLTADPGNEGEPVWTPDGTRIVYTATPEGGLARIKGVQPDGKDDRVLASSPGGNHSPDVSPDGRTIAFVSARDGNQEIYLMPVAGGEARRITRTGERESSPHFLPGGDIVCVADRGRAKGSAVLRLGPGEAEAATLLETDQPIASFDLSTGGERAAYVLGRLTDASRGKVQFSFFLHPLAAGTSRTQVSLQPGEQVAGPSF